jgi:rubrerythrin
MERRIDQRRPTMSITFNAFEIFEIAEQIERNGAKFYRKAAQNISNQGIRKMLLELAVMEDNHEQTFADMRKQISYKERELITFDPENEVALYLQAMANGHVFDLKKDPSKQLKGKETIEDILKIAIEAEKDSIVFYLGLRDFVPIKAGKNKIEDIIKEERSHIALLSQKLSALKK